MHKPTRSITKIQLITPATPPPPPLVLPSHVIHVTCSIMDQQVTPLKSASASMETPQHCPELNSSPEVQVENIIPSPPHVCTLEHTYGEFIFPDTPSPLSLLQTQSYDAFSTYGNTLPSLDILLEGDGDDPEVDSTEEKNFNSHNDEIASPDLKMECESGDASTTINDISTVSSLTSCEAENVSSSLSPSLNKEETNNEESSQSDARPEKIRPVATKRKSSETEISHETAHNETTIRIDTIPPSATCEDGAARTRLWVRTEPRCKVPDDLPKNQRLVTSLNTEHTHNQNESPRMLEADVEEQLVEVDPGTVTSLVPVFNPTVRLRQDDPCVLKALQNFWENIKMTYYPDPSDTTNPHVRCLECRTTPLREDIVNHYLRTHPESEVAFSRLPPQVTMQALLEEPLPPPKSPVLLCRFCDFKNGEKTTFYDHCTSHTGEFRFECVQCLFRSHSPSQVMRHAHMKHGRAFSEEEEEEEVRVLCEVDKSDLRVEAHVCSLCHFLQISRDTVLRHVTSKHALFPGVAICKVNLAQYWSKSEILPRLHMKRRSSANSTT